MAAEINVGGWAEDVARINALGAANAVPEVSGKPVEPAVSTPVVITFETPAPVEEPVLEVPEAPAVPEVPEVVAPVEAPVVPTVPVIQS